MNELIRELVEALEYSSDFLSRSASRFDDVIETLAKARAYLETGGWTRVEDGLPVVWPLSGNGDMQMTPDQLPPGVRVKALEWARAKGISDEIWYSGGYCAGRYSFDDGQWHYSLSDAPLKRTPCKSINAAKAACQRHHEEQVCAQLEIVNG